jgi:hypothetical protein
MWSGLPEGSCMYDFLDRPVGTLDEGSRFLVWSMRGWTQSVAERRCPPSVLAAGFARSDLDAMLPHFHMAMMALNRDGREKIGVGEMGCSIVSEGEAVMLSLVRLFAIDRVPAACATIALLVREEGVATLRRALTTVAILTFARFPLDMFGNGDSGTFNGGMNPRVDGQ